MLPDIAYPFLTLLGALLLDRALGEPRRFHPLAGFGTLASALERRLRRDTQAAALARFAGIAGVLLLIVPAVLLLAWLSHLPVTGPAIDVVVLYFCIAPRSLEEHARAVGVPLAAGDLAAAREAVARIVSRDTESMDEGDIARATVESVLENGNDAIFGAIFWFLLAGAPGALAFRLANTLDAMWGYRTPRFLHFGWAAARLDDLLNWVPARLTAFSYCIAGDTANGFRCWREQARQWYSPNAGPVMAAGAGALSVMLGGRARYAGEWKDRPTLGSGEAARPEHIDEALALVRRSIRFWLVMCMYGTVISWWFLRHA